MPTQQAVSTGIPGLDAALTVTGYRYSFDSAFRLDRITGHVQHRSADRQDRATMKRYATMRKAGSQPPPIGVCRDGHVVWGNHRIGGAEMGGFETIPAIVLDIDGGQADPHMLDQLLSLAVEENAPHGLPYTSQDRTQRAASLLNLGYTNTSVSAKLGLTPSQVSGIKRELEAEQRMVTLGLDPGDFDKRGVLQAFSGPDARALNNDPFIEVVRLAKDAKFTAAEINALARGAKDAGSDVDALSHIAQVRQDEAQRIHNVAISGQSARPTPVGKLRGALRNLESLCDAAILPVIYKDHTDGAPETVAMLDAAIACLQGIRAVQDPVTATV